MRFVGIGLAGAALAVMTSGLGAQTPAATTLQQDFDAATALDTKGDSAGALVAWERLEARAKPGSRSRGIALVRKSATLFKLGRLDAAVTAARSGLALLPASDRTLAEDRWRAHYNIGRIAADTIDYAGASTAFAAAERASDDPALRMTAMLAFVETATFTDPAAAQAALSRIDAMAAAQKFDPTSQAAMARRHALLAMNRGDFTQARTYAKTAVKLLGGLTSKTDTQDVSARSDVAIASLLAGKVDDAREYMAMTGAGRLNRGNFDPAVAMAVPDCGGEAGLKPADLAVVEFSIGDDGVVRGVAPIYAAGGGMVAMEFARAVRDWSWTPEQTKDLPPFFRSNVRIEMRCSTAFERPSIGSVIDSDFRAWMEGKGVPIPEKTNQADAVAVAAQRSALAAAEAKDGASALSIVPALYALSINSVVGREETNALARRAQAIVDANGAPPMARLLFDLKVRETGSADPGRNGAYARAVTPLLSEPAYADDAQARSAIRLLLADSERRAKSGRARAMLEQVASDAALARADPMRVGALIRLASLEQASGDAAAARKAFDSSGLAANQCAILDAPPRFLSAGGVFPHEAQVWGFEGWTLTQFDVGAEGKVVNERAVLSYPPFVFTKAGTNTVATARYSKTFRPDGGVGCGGLSQRVRFTLPN